MSALELNPLERIRQTRGLMARIAKEIGYESRGTVSQWKRVPAERAELVERLSGIPRHELRPDLWKPPASESEAG